MVSMAQSDRSYLQALEAYARYSELCHAAVMELDALMPALDPEIRRYFRSIVDGRIKKPKGKRGPKPKLDREFCITSAVTWCTRYGLKPDRYDGATHESGCSLVAQALKQAEINRLREPGIKKIWSQRPRLRVHVTN